MSASASTLRRAPPAPLPDGSTFPSSAETKKRRFHTYIFYPAGSVEPESGRHPLPPWLGADLVSPGAPERSALVDHIRL